MTPMDLAQKMVDEHLPELSSGHRVSLISRLARDLVLWRAEVVEQDRRARPTLVGAPLGEEQLEAVRAHDRAATPPPWEWARDYETGGELHWGIRHPTDPRQSLWPLVSESTDQNWAGDPDALFVCAARVAVPALLAHADFLHSLVADLSEDGSAYARGLRDGMERAALAIEGVVPGHADKVRALKGAAP